MPRPAYGFCYTLVTYLMEYVSLSPCVTGIPRRLRTGIRVQPIAAARGTRQTDGRTDRQPHFIMPLPMEVGA